MCQTIIFNVIILVLLELASGRSYEGYKVYSFITTNDEENEFLRSLETNHDFYFLSPINRVGRSVFVMASPEGQGNLENWLQITQIQYKVVNQNVERTLTEHKIRRNKRQSQPPGRLDFNQYNRHAEINAYLSSIAKNYPTQVSLDTTGKSYQGRDINLVRISTGGGGKKRAIFVDAGMHAREWVAPAEALHLIHQLVENPKNKRLTEDVDWIILPNANPDGYEYTWDVDRFWRKTVSPNTECSGTDPNRNFDFHWNESGADPDECSMTYAGIRAFSETEARNLRDYFQKTQNIEAYITLHSCGNYLLYPWGYGYVLAQNAEQLEEVGFLMKEAIKSVGGSTYIVGNVAFALYPAAGASDDWAKHIGIDIVLTWELPCGSGSDQWLVDPTDLPGVHAETFEGFKALHNYVMRKNSSSVRRNEGGIMHRNAGGIVMVVVLTILFDIL